jgi:hypothetical protein
VLSIGVGRMHPTSPFPFSVWLSLSFLVNFMGSRLVRARRERTIVRNICHLPVERAEMSEEKRWREDIEDVMIKECLQYLRSAQRGTRKSSYGHMGLNSPLLRYGDRLTP